ncbi:LOW QUALITY PROTEIN: Na(+)/H(+) exchange regulatory cofactor NHE-RF1 [Metopolophium dirhodum]|uniref:LOW QUALITY PROTEIN: Na(+)/H(+) exchange regulatory cofactor NHE-RF1 n=1 Tax=Metopolophium dirhodum TaxID=44670 RepID=UPI00298FDA99|nr:LOW QUALITY PROTEIN: Na(+)/H(+) exchange regulatory cofactor NHE-RF1 [Metopolophium dirhodum]
MSSHDANNEQEPQQVAEPTVRLCVLRTWPDHFDGYGFNLHAEKSKTSASSPNGGLPFSGGQFVGKVDRGSPAESAGLREGDRIVQVDGVDIDGETHSKVVARIKKGSAGDGAEDDNESVSRCSLLVVDRRADTYYREKGIRVHADMGLQILVLRTPEEPTPECLALQPQNAPSPKNAAVADDSGAKQQPNDSDETAKPTNSTTSTTTTLNLNMTAAELRRRLAERKKQDSRRPGGAGDGSLDFRKKYEIVDKL